MSEHDENHKEQAMALAIRPKATTHHYSNGTDMQSAKTRVFNIPELLELILDHLEIPDIMRLFQLCSSMNAFILGSTKLHCNLPFKMGHTVGETRFPFATCMAGMPSSFRCFEIQLPSTYSSPGVVHIQASFHVGRALHLLPLIGPRYKSMFICQPPPTEMNIYVSTISDRRGRQAEAEIFPAPGHARQRYIGTVSSAGGFRIGDLYRIDKVEKSIKEYEKTENRSRLGSRADKGWHFCFIGQ